VPPQREWFEKDYYKVLGVPETATAKEIKSAYRKLSRKLHPDANPGDVASEERFKEVSAAYDVVGDEAKRKEYDEVRRMGPMGPMGGGGPGGFSFNTDDLGGLGDLFGNLFGRGRGREPRGAGPQRGVDLEAELQLSFAGAVQGVTTSVNITSDVACHTCHGSGAKPGTSPTTCPRCEGRGVEAQGQGFFSISQPCSMCGGAGQIVEDPCPTCGGSGLTQQNKRYKVNVPAGVKDGTRIRLAGKGEDGPRGGPPGDLYVTTRVASSPIFKRLDGGNLEVTVPISIPEALRGGTIEVPTLNGTKKIKVAPGTKHGTIQRLRGEGPPKPKGAGRGDIRYRLEIAIPADLSEEQSEAVEKLAETLNGSDPRAELLRKAGA
jgi:molecular chaperone DnaJ